MTRDPEKIKPTDNTVVQKYMHKPHLIDDLKYDLRVYAVVFGMNPIRCYICNDGLARFATHKYQKPGEKNLADFYMHLTNYAVNKNNEEFQ